MRCLQTFFDETNAVVQSEYCSRGADHGLQRYVRWKSIVESLLRLKKQSSVIDRVRVIALWKTEYDFSTE